MGNIPGVRKHVFHVLCIETLIAAHKPVAKVGKRSQIGSVGQLDGREASLGGSGHRVVIFKIDNDVARSSVIKRRLQRPHRARKIRRIRALRNPDANAGGPKQNSDVDPMQIARIARIALGLIVTSKVNLFVNGDIHGVNPNSIEGRAQLAYLVGLSRSKVRVQRLNPIHFKVGTHKTSERG
jgi:hypothetical protein